MPATQELIDWADEIFVFSEAVDKHSTFLREHLDLTNKRVNDLQIFDIYGLTRLDALSALLREKLVTYLQ